jgi:hypothetical protein
VKKFQDCASTDRRTGFWLAAPLFIAIGVTVYSLAAAQNGGQLDSTGVGLVNVSLEVINGVANTANTFIETEQSSSQIDVILSRQLGEHGTIDFPLCVYGDGQQSFAVDRETLNATQRYLATETGEQVPYRISVSGVTSANGEYVISTVQPDECTAETALNIQLSIPDDYQLPGNTVLSGSFQILLKAE